MQQGELVQSELNRAATLAMRDNLQSLLLLADKLYKRNPVQWRAGAFTSRAQALLPLSLSPSRAQPVRSVPRRAGGEDAR